MSSEQSSVNAETIEQTKQQIRNLVSEIAQLSKSDLSPQEYYSAFLQRIVSALAAVGGAIWLLAEGKRPKLNYQINIAEMLLDEASEESAQHTRLLQHIVRTSEPQLIPPMSGASDPNAGGNPTRHLLVLAPLVADGIVEGIIEIFQRPDSQPATQRGYLRFLLQMCELASEWLKSQKLRNLSTRHSLWQQADQFSRLVHESLDVRQTCYTITNEGRRLIGCDRVSVAIKRGSKCIIEAISGQDTLENRSNIVAKLGTLATRVVAMGEPLWYEGSAEDLPPQVEQALDEYVDESYAKGIYLLPLRRPEQYDAAPQTTVTGDVVGEENVDREIIGALIVEQIESDVPREVLEPRVDLVYEHSARAVSNALSHNGLFLMPVWRTLGQASWVLKGRTLPKTLTIAGIILACLLALLLVPWRFDMEAKGELQPIEQRQVYSNIEGDIQEVFVIHGQTVTAGQDLARINNTDLEVQYKEAIRRRNEALEELYAVKFQLQDKSLKDEERARLTGRHSQLEDTADNYETQVQLIDEKRSRLTVKSPIAGTIVTWDVKELLQGRTVTAGQALLTVADTSSMWELRLHMPERRMGHINRARAKDKELKVRYVIATDPGNELHGKVREIHSATDAKDQEGTTVLIDVDIQTEELKNPRPGATVTGKVHCGWAPIGYTWFHEAWEWVQLNVLF